MARRIANLSVRPEYFVWSFMPDDFDYKALRDKVQNEWWVWDCDQCGDKTTTWVIMFDTPQFYRVEHTWWIEEYPRFEVRNEFAWWKIDRSQLTDAEKQTVKFVV